MLNMADYLFIKTTYLYLNRLLFFNNLPPHPSLAIIYLYIEIFLAYD
jgi:hypothetical protein